MAGIPTINIVAVVHLIFISMFIGLYMAESVMELYSYFNKNDTALHHSIIRLHYWIDILFELPIMMVALAAGITMAFLVDSLTTPHVIKITAAGLFYVIAGRCPLMVFKRYRLLKKNATEEVLLGQSRGIILVAGFTMTLLFTTALVLGFWLAYHRVLKSIYGG